MTPFPTRMPEVTGIERHPEKKQHKDITEKYTQARSLILHLETVRKSYARQLDILERAYYAKHKKLGTNCLNGSVDKLNVCVYYLKTK